MKWYNGIVLNTKVVKKIVIWTVTISFCLSYINIHLATFTKQTTSPLLHFLSSAISDWPSNVPSFRCFCLLFTVCLDVWNRANWNKGTGEQIRVDYIGCVGMLIACLLTECCRTTWSWKALFVSCTLTGHCRQPHAPHCSKPPVQVWRGKPKQFDFLLGFIHTAFFFETNTFLFHSGNRLLLIESSE